MKTKITLKELRIMKGNNNLYFVDYCKLQNLLKCVEPNYFYSNNYGWRFDIYLINGFIIATGYERPRITGVKQLKEVEKFENLANKIYLNSNSWEQKQNESRKLLNKFIEINGGN